MKIVSFIRKYKFQISLFILTLLFFNHFFLNPGKMLIPGDILGSAYFPKFFFSSFVKENYQIPLWNPYMFAGIPFLADPSSSMFYPLNILYLLIPLGFAFSYLFILDIFLIGLFTYLFAKTINLDNISSFLSGLIFMLSGTIMFRIYAGHLYILDAIVWLPLLLTIYELALKKRKFIFGILGAIPITLMVFAGHSQFTFYNLLFSSGYFFLRLILIYKENRNLSSVLKLILIFLLSIIIGLGLSAIQLIPSLEFSSISERSSGISFDFASAFSLHPYQLLSFIFPYFFGSPFNSTFWGKGNFWETCGYIGLAPLIFATIAVFYNKNRYIFIFLFSSIFALILSFGNYTPLYRVIFSNFPIFDLFRAPARFLYIYAFSLSILAGFGFNFILTYKFNKAELKKLKKIILLSISFIFLIIIFVIYLIFSKNLYLYEKFVLRNSFAVGINHLTLFNQTIFDILRFCLFSLTTFIFIYLYIIKKIQSYIFVLGITTIIFIDLWIFNFGVVDLSKTNEINNVPPVIKTIEKDKSIYRIFSQSGDYSTVAIVNGQQILTGYNGEYLKSYRDFLWLTGKHENTPFESFIIINSIDNPSILSLLNTKYIIWNKKIQIKNFKFINEYDNNKTKSFLYENLSYFPRAYIISEQALKEGRFIISKSDAKLPSLNNKSKFNFLNINKSDISNSARIDNYSADKIILNVSMRTAGYLVLSEIWYPGWKAYDNGSSKEIFKGDYVFRSIYLTKGKHNIKFVFDPSSYKIGKAISLITLFLVFLILLFVLKSKFFYKQKPKLPHLP